MILTVVFYVFVAFTAIQISYYLFFSSFLFKNKKQKSTSSQVPVSVIIFAKNSAKALQKNLPFILAQNYPEFEIVLINNASTDETLEIMEGFRDENKNIKIIDVENNEAFWANKKYALTLGIKAATHDHLLFTDASSEPLSEFWIAEMSKNATTTKSITLGYEKYKIENTLTNLFIRFEHLLNAIQCFSFAKSGAPFMAFGGNLAYQKKDFFKVNGFIKHIKLKYGETNLFIRDAATTKNINYTISKKSFIEIDAPNSFYEWFQKQRIKRAIQNFYKRKHRYLLSFFTFSKIVFYGLGIYLIFVYPWQIMLPIFLFYVLIQYLVIGFSAKKFKEPYLLFFLPFLEISLLLIQISIFIANLISKPNIWK